MSCQTYSRCKNPEAERNVALPGTDTSQCDLTERKPEGRVGGRAPILGLAAGTLGLLDGLGSIQRELLKGFSK